MRLRLIFEASVVDADDIKGLREQIGMCFEELGGVRLLSVTPVKGSAPPKVERGAYGHVMLSDGEYEKLVARYGKGKAEALISSFSYKLHQKHYQYADHFAAIVEWEEQERGNAPAAASFDVDDFFNANVERINKYGN